MNMFIVVSDVLTINYSLCNKVFEVGHICKYVLVQCARMHCYYLLTRYRRLADHDDDDVIEQQGR